MTDDRELVLHSSVWRLALQGIAPVVLLALGASGLVTGARILPWVLLALGTAAASVTLFDLPLRTEFDADGLVRVCPLRRHRMPWSRIVAIERLPGLTGLGRDDADKSTPSRGLAARSGPRRVHLLVDRRESQAEYRHLRRLLDDRATQLRAKEPPIDAAPAGRGPRALHRRDRA